VCTVDLIDCTLLLVGLVASHDLFDELVDAARVLELDLGTSPIEVLQLAEHCGVALEPNIETFQLVTQLLSHVCTRHVTTINTRTSIKYGSRGVGRLQWNSYC